MFYEKNHSWASKYLPPLPSTSSKIRFYLKCRDKEVPFAGSLPRCLQQAKSQGPRTQSGPPAWPGMDLLPPLSWLLLRISIGTKVESDLSHDSSPSTLSRRRGSPNRAFTSSARCQPLSFISP